MAAPPSKLRKFIGILKDEASVSMAKFGSSLDPDLEILIIKATSHNDDIPSPKYMTEILHKASISGEFVKASLSLISNRIEKTHDWIVGLKSLLVVHMFMVDGGRIFLEEIANVGLLRNLHEFRNELHSDSSTGYCDFVRRYGMYLSWKVDSIVFDKMWLRKKVRLNDDDDDKGLNGFEGSKCFNEMETERVLIHMEQLQTMLGRVLDCFPRTKRKHHKIVLRALSPVVEESFGLYKEICDGLSVLVDRFWAMDYLNSAQSYGIYVTVAKQINELVGFYAWCEGGEIARPAEYTHIERVSDDLLRSFEELLISKGKSANSSSAVNPSTIRDEYIYPDLCESEATCASETPATDPTCIIDSELALVESESNLAAKPEAELGGSFDSLVVDGMYDQGSFGSASSQPLPGLESEESSVHVVVDEDPVEEKPQLSGTKITRQDLKEGTSFFDWVE